MRFAFYGRVSTEDQQDPESSRAWQLAKAQGLADAAGGSIVAEYFDLGHSRSLPWRRRPEATRLLLDVADPARAFDAIVVGEASRAFGDGTDQATTLRVLEHHGVTFWSPDTSGAFDRANISHRLMGAIKAELAQEERETIRRRVRDAMREQARDGRFLGGRPPYGYRLADAGPHPNPSKAGNGQRLHVLEPDPVTAPIVTRIFDLYLGGLGWFAIAERLTAEGLPCPSAHDRARNRHRDGSAWSRSAVRAIITNPRYTGRQVWNRSRRDETQLLDPTDPTMGSDYRQVWNERGEWVWSVELAHEPIVDVDTFTAAQELIAAGSHRPATKKRPTSRPYMLRGLLFCGHPECGKRMEGTWNHGRAHYRCKVGREYAAATGSTHPATVYVREDQLAAALDAWIATLFDPQNVDATIAALADAGPLDEHAEARADAARRTIETSDQKLERHRAALEAGADPTIVAGWMAEVRGERLAAMQTLAAASPQPTMTAADVRQLIDELGDIAAVLAVADPAAKAQVYADLGLRLTLDPSSKRVAVVATPCTSERVGGARGPSATQPVLRGDLDLTA